MLCLYYSPSPLLRVSVPSRDYVPSYPEQCIWTWRLGTDAKRRNSTFRGMYSDILVFRTNVLYEVTYLNTVGVWTADSKYISAFCRDLAILF